MKTSTKTSKLRRHVCLLLAAAAVPTSALSLSNFQLITSLSVPFTCIRAYDQQLPNCALSDFTQQNQQNQNQQNRRDTGNTCSAACRSGIALAQQTIKTSCSGLVSRGGSGSGSSTSLSSSVLGVALTGDLVGLLCGGTNSSTSTAAAAATTTNGGNNNVNGVATSEVLTSQLTSTVATNTSTSVATTFDPTITSTIADGPVQQQPAVATEDTAEASLSLLLLSSLSSLSSLPFFSQAAATASPVTPGQSSIQSAGTAADTGTSITVKTSKTGNVAPPSPTVATEAVSKESQLSDSNVRGGGSPFDAQVVNGAWRLGPSITLVAAGSIVAVLC